MGKKPVDPIYLPDHIRTHDQRLRVFISSTIREMEAERKAAKAVIEQLRLTPILFEDNARPHPPQDVYRRLLAQADVFIAVYGDSYGWVGPDMAMSGLEEEYNLSEGKPRLVYVREDHGQRDAHLTNLLSRIESEAQVSYKRFQSCVELSSFIKDDVMQLLSERFAIDPAGARGPIAVASHVDRFLAERERKVYLARPTLFGRLKEMLAQHAAVMVTGDPGLGKTYLVTSYAAAIGAAYMSVRNRTPQSVFSQIANQLRQRAGQAPGLFPSEADARLALQRELAHGSNCVVLDDVDASGDVFRAVLDLDLYNSRLLVAARDPQLAAAHGIAELKMPPFTTDEATIFLNKAAVDGVRQAALDFADARLRNPLYLYYYSSFPVAEIPKNLASYQRALWHNLSPIEQDLVLIIAHSYQELDVQDIHTLRGSAVEQPLTVTSALINHLPLIQHLQTGYRLFHPYFEEFVLTEAVEQGLSRHYHTMLAALSRQRGWTVATAFHYYHADDDQLAVIGLPAAHVLVVQGEWALADDILLKTIRIAEARTMNGGLLARVHYLRAHLSLERGLHEQARTEGDAALSLLASEGDDDFRVAVQIWTSHLLVDEGHPAEAIAQLQSTIAQSAGVVPHREAMARVNLAHAYIRTSQFHEAAQEASRALALFTELGDDEGVDTCVTNLSNCLGGLNRRAEQRVYIDRMLASAEKRGSLRGRAAALNHLAGWLRKNKQPVDAQRALEEAIAIAQKLGSLELEVLYVANLGNALRDQANREGAERRYAEAIRLARLHGLQRWEGYGMEMLGELRTEQGQFEDALRLSTDALAIHETMGDQIRVATVLDNLGTLYRALDDSAKAADHEQRAANTFERIGQHGQAADSYAWAAHNWQAAGEMDRALQCRREAVDSALKAGRTRRALRLINQFLEGKPRPRVGALFLRVLASVLRSNAPLVGLVYEISTYAKGHPNADERTTFREMLNVLVKELKVEARPTLLLALAAAIEQTSEAILGPADWEQYVSAIATSLKRLYYTPVRNGIRVWTVGMNWQQPGLLQVCSAEESRAVRSVAAALALMFSAKQEFLQTVIAQLGQSQSAVDMILMSEVDGRQYANFEWPADWKAPVATPAWDRTRHGSRTLPTIVVLRDNYESQSDWSEHPNNNTFLLAIALAARAVLSAFTGRDAESEEIRNAVTTLIRQITGNDSNEDETETD